MMTAVVARRYGPPEVLKVEKLPIPQPGPGQIQVRVTAAALNPTDLWGLSGAMRESAPLRFPHVPGSDFAGTVTKVGPGVTRFAVGDELFGLGYPRTAVETAKRVSSPPSLTTGTMAEYAVFDDTPALAPRPAELDAEHAATLPITGLAALALLRVGTFEAGDTILVIGAAGGLGGAVVPMLAAAKAHVIATAIPADERYVRDLGAAEVIDYRAVDAVTETLRRHPDGVDALVNLALPGERLDEASRAIRPNGRLMNIATPNFAPSALRRTDLTVDGIYTAARPGDLEQLAARAMEGTLRSTISRRYHLGVGERAYADLANEHTRGKLIVVMGNHA